MSSCCGKHTYESKKSTNNILLYENFNLTIIYFVFCFAFRCCKRTCYCLQSVIAIAISFAGPSGFGSMSGLTELTTTISSNDVFFSLFPYILGFPSTFLSITTVICVCVPCSFLLQLFSVNLGYFIYSIQYTVSSTHFLFMKFCKVPLPAALTTLKSLFFL